MANEDKPKGFEPLYNLVGGDMRNNSYTLTTGQTVFKGDLIKMVAAGTVEEADANDGIVVVGVAAEYVDDSASAGGKEVLVWDNPYMVFRVQMDDVGTASTAADVGQTANHIAGAGSSVNNLSGHELDMSDIDTGAQLKIVALIKREGNVWGANADVAVLINEHRYNAAVAKV